MATSFRNVRTGDTVEVKFNGSTKFGNEAYVMTAEVLYATKNMVTLSGGISITFFNNRWRYGTSGEVATLVSRSPAGSR